MAKRPKKIVCGAQKVQSLLAECAPAAVTRLTELMNNESAETARKACVDILKLQLEQTPQAAPKKKADDSGGLDAALAERLLKALADEHGATAEPRPS